MLVGNEDKRVLSKGEVTAVRNMPLPTFPSWEGTLASQGAHETSGGGSQFPEVSAEQVDVPEQRCFVWVTICLWTKDHSEVLIHSQCYLYNQPSFLVHISSSKEHLKTSYGYHDSC